MAYAFRASASVGNSSGACIAITKPVGTADGDLIVVNAYLEPDTNAWTSVCGFSLAASTTNVGAFKLATYYKIASSEPTAWNWQFSASNNWRSVVISSYSGAPSSASVDATSACSGDSQILQNQVAPTVSTTAASNLLIFAYGNFSGIDSTTTCGAALNLRKSFGGTLICDTLSLAQGSSGSSTPGAGPGLEDYAAMHIAFTLAGGGGGAAAPVKGYLKPMGIFS